MGVDVQRHAAALLEGEIAFDEEEATDAQQCVVECDADQGPVVIEHKIGTTGAERQSLIAVAAGKVDEGTRALNPFPVTTLVETDLQALQLELEQRPVDHDVSVPVHLQGVHVGNHAVWIGGVGRIHEHQTEVDVVQCDAPAVVVQAFTGIKQAVAVGVDEVRAQAHKNVHIGGGQEGRRNRQAVNATEIAGHAIDFAQTTFERRVVVHLVGAQARADVDQRRFGLLEVEATADVDVV